MTDEQKPDPTESDSEKKPSPLDQIRAKAAASESSEGEPASDAAEKGAEEKDPGKKLSPIEQMRAKAKEKDSGSDSGEKKKLSPIEQMRAKSASGKGSPAAPKPQKAAAEKPAAAAPKKPAVKPKPKVPKMKPGASTGATSDNRRAFISWVGVAWSAFSAACSAATLAAVRFMYPNVLKEPPSVFKIGPPDQFAEGEVNLRWKDKYGVWIAKVNSRVYALRAVCTHLGCTPNWLEGEQKFKCPCHGSGFRKTGMNFEGPAPRPLERYAVTLTDDGQVQVDKSKILHDELGQWTPENGAWIDVF